MIKSSGNAYPKSNKITIPEAQAVTNLFRQYFPNVAVITSPEKGDPFLTLGHGFIGMTHMDVNGLKMKSPLFTMALLSCEVAEDQNGNLHYAHAYEVMFPNIPNLNGKQSNMGQYIKDIWSSGLEVHADHYHWKTGDLSPAIHHMGVNMTPMEFAIKTINALNRLQSNTETLLIQAEPQTMREMVRDEQVLEQAEMSVMPVRQNNISVANAELINLNGGHNTDLTIRTGGRHRLYQ